MKCHYDRLEDVQQYITNGVFRYDGKAVYVHKVLKDKKGEGFIQIAPIEKMDETFDIDVYDDLFDISFPDLGYINLEEKDKAEKKVLKVGFLAKKFNRQFNQGLTNRNTTLLDIEGKPIPYANYLYTKAVQDLIQNRYPSFEDAWGMLKGDNEVAISRDVALKSLKDSGLILVFYKTTNVGWVTPGSTTVIVPTSDMAWLVSKYLREFTWEIQ